MESTSGVLGGVIKTPNDVLNLAHLGGVQIALMPTASGIKVTQQRYAALRPRPGNLSSRYTLGSCDNGPIKEVIMEQIAEMVKEWQKTKSIRLAYEICQKLAKEQA